MDLTFYLIASAASYLNVALRSFQQLNVVHERRRWVAPTSILMAVCEAMIFTSYMVAGIDWLLILMTGAGAAAGCLTSMSIHGRLRGR